MFAWLTHISLTFWSWSLSCFVQVYRSASALIRGNSLEYSSLAPQPYFQLSHHRHFYSERLRRTLSSSSLPSALVSLHLSHISVPATCHPSIINTPTHAPTRTYACMHASVAAKGRPNASFDAMALWSLSWFPPLLCSSIIHSLHIVCVCRCSCVGMQLCQKQNLAKQEGGKRWETVAVWVWGCTFSLICFGCLYAARVLYLIAFQLTHLPFPYETVSIVCPVKVKWLRRDGIGSHIHIWPIYTHTHTHVHTLTGWLGRKRLNDLCEGSSKKAL